MRLTPKQHQATKKYFLEVFQSCKTGDKKTLGEFDIDARLR